ncbi:SURF1 family protein [Solicola sp. PLA-1-18]|uniref:SURF1 family protein n=1 Tax=Solicola sp. PLA-1-18 TaxID=3380532 RepID=UPI003B7C9DF2
MPERRPSTLRIVLRPAMVGLHVFAVAALVFCVLMGLWQLGVYDSRQASERADRQEVPTVPLDEALGPDEAFTNTANHRPVTVAGTYGPSDTQVWVSGREQDGREGYWLLAPVLTGGVGDDGRPHALVVVRGFATQAGDPPPTPAGRVELRGVLEIGEARSTAAEPGDGRTIDAVRLPLLANELPYDLYSGFAIVTSPEPADGLEAVPPPLPDASWTTGLTNLAYTLQWWVFGAFAVFMWWRMTRDAVARRQAAWDAAASEESHDTDEPEPVDARR